MLEEIKKALINMFGFIWTQPIYITLRKMRLVPVSMLANAVALLWYIAIQLKTLDPIQAAIAYGAIAAALIPTIVVGLNSLLKANDKED
jgi:hypothetical protein